MRTLQQAIIAATATLLSLTYSSVITAAPYPTRGLVAAWGFDNDTPREVLDSRGSSHGVATDVTYEDGAIGKAASFNGESSKILITDSKGNTPNAITSLKTGTISFWVKFENIGGQVLPILYLGKDNSSMPSRSMIFEVGHDRGNINNRRLYFTSIVSQQENFCVDSGLDLTPSVWYHYVAVMSEKGSTLYINGVEITTRRYNLGSNRYSVNFFDNIPNKDLLSIGYGKYSQEEPFFSFNGLIDDIKLYNRPLKKDEVTELFEMGGMKMGDPELGYIDAESMVGKEPIERSGKGGRGGKGGQGGQSGGYGRGSGGRNSSENVSLFNNNGRNNNGYDGGYNKGNSSSNSDRQDQLNNR